MQQNSNTTLRIIVFISVGAIGYIGLALLGYGSEAYKTLSETLKIPLQSLLSGAIAGAAALIIPAKKPPPTSDSPPAPPEKVQPSRTTENVVSKNVYNEAAGHLDEWQQWGSHAQRRIQELEKLNDFLDTKQTLLRLMVFGMLSYGATVAVAGFLAPKLSSGTFLHHIAYLAFAYCIVGFAIGVGVQLVRVTTTLRNALRSAWLGAVVINLAGFMLALPYAFGSLWAQRVITPLFEGPLLIVMFIARVGLFPLIAGAASGLGFMLSINRPHHKLDQS